MRRARLGFFCLCGILIAVVAIVAFRGAGRWLCREDPLSRADVIFVLSGSMPYRAEEAGKVFAAGYAPEVWLSRPDNPADQMEKLGVHFVAEEDYNREILMHAGVPASAIRILPATVINTEQEVQEMVREMRKAGKTKVIIVTSAQHTRRTRAILNKLGGKDQTALLHAAPDPFDADHWWRNTRDVLSVVRETLGLVNAWAGLPVPPAQIGGH